VCVFVGVGGEEDVFSVPCVCCLVDEHVWKRGLGQIAGDVLCFTFVARISSRFKAGKKTKSVEKLGGVTSCDSRGV
jgi:hypothetical protein